MKLFGLEMRWPMSREKAGTTQQLIPASSGAWGGWFGPIFESFTGAFQRNVVVDSRECILAFSAVYACVARIAGDIAKMGVELREFTPERIWELVDPQSPYWRVLRRPNGFQTWYQFIEQWVISKLLAGNAYVLKVRDGSGIVAELYVLDPRRVQPLVTPDGGVYYQLSADNLVALEGQITVPASEIIHDRMNCLFHPLVGVSPIYACGISATQGNRIQANGAKFFENMSRPSGILTAPQPIDASVIERLKTEFESKYGGSNIGRTFIAAGGGGFKYEPLTINAVDAQLIEQLKWTVEDVARAFGVPLYKIGAGNMPALTNIEAVNQQYYADCIQTLLESAEAVLNLGFGFTTGEQRPYAVNFDVASLFRMDTLTRFTAASNAIGGGWLAPNEARRWENLRPVKGGNSPMMQQQNWSLEQLATRKAPDDKPAVAAPPVQSALPAPSPADEADGEKALAWFHEFTDELSKGFAALTVDVLDDEK